MNNKKMNKVVIMTSVHPVFDTRIFHKQAKTLVKSGYDVTLIAQHDRDETVEGIKIISLQKPNNRYERLIKLSLQVLFMAIKEKADVYHFHDPELLFISLIIKIVTHAKVIYDIHENVKEDILNKEWIPSLFKKFLSKAYSLVERACFFIFNRIIVAGDDIVSNFPRSSKVVVVRNYPLIDKMKPIYKKRESQREYLALIYTGTIEKERGIIETIEAVDSLKGKARLILLGWFADHEFESEIKDRVNDNIQLIGRVPFDKVPYFMEKSDVGIICLLPSPNNINAASRNNKLFEYMSAGLPVISSNFPLWIDIVEGNNCGLTVDPMNSKEIAKAIEYLQERPELMEEMGRNGRNAVLEKYNWEQESIKLLDVYTNILRSKINAV